ncbi:MAG TPA: Ig-like domain-containing protein [Kofleriaceae bacterium]|nr:Ig-like domain-containing protein [Kofleriaceae bacterium]
MMRLASVSVSSLAALLLLVPLGCGSVDDSGDGGDEQPDGGAEPDGGDESAAPQVESVAPDDGATGVAPDTKIKIVFDRAMDTDSVEAAWSSEALPASEVAFSWNASGTTLTVTADGGLPVAEGSGLDPSGVTPVEVAYSIAASAVDADGIPLQAPVEVSFTTVRRMIAELEHVPLLTDERAPGGVSVAGSNSIVYAGDDSSNRPVRAGISFDISGVPDGAAIEGATFHAQQTNLNNTPFDDLGDLLATHVTFAAVSDLYEAEALASLGVFSSSAELGERSVPVTGAVVDDLAHLEERGGYSQYRLQFTGATDGDGLYDAAQFQKENLRLVITYLVP